jgi:hypothetical protein
MSAGEVTQGKRRPDDTEPHELERGEYSLTAGGNAVWLMSPEGKAGHVHTPVWLIVEEADGTITVNPSIWWDSPTGWHGYLERGVWREV